MAFILAKMAFLSEFQVISKNRHFKFLFSQISVLCVVLDIILARMAFLSQFEERSENCYFIALSFKISSSRLALALIIG